MATAIAFRFPLGRYHGNPWGHNVNEGVVDWPPEPWRILRALLATAFNRCPEVAEEDAFSMLCQLVDPPQFRVPTYTLAHTRHYMPDRTHLPGVKVGTDKVLDAFAACDPSSELVVEWPVDLDKRDREILGVLCDRLPYLGRAESLCDARLLDDPSDADVAGSGRAEPDGAGVERAGETLVAVDLLTPTDPLDRASLVLRTTQVRKRKLIDPPSTRRVRYHVPPPSVAQADGRSHASVRQRSTADAVRFRIVAPALPSATATVAMTDVLRSAALSQYGARTDGGRSATLAGKGPEGAPLRDHQHAHYLGFTADVGRGERLIDTLVVWAPGGLDETEVAALASIRKLTGHGHLKDFRACALGVEGIGSVAEVAPELVAVEGRGATRWRGITPFAISRHPRRNADVGVFVRAEVERGLTFVGYPNAAVTLRRRDALSFLRHRNKEGLRQARRSFFVDLEFSEPVAGPVSIGALNHFGLGLFAPRTD